MPRAATLLSEISVTPDQLGRGEAVSGDLVGGGGIGVRVLVFEAHGDAFAPELAEQARAREQISEDGIQIEDVHAARAGFGSPMQAFDEELDHFALKGIVEIDQERRARPAEIENILMDDANGRARAMFLLPFLYILPGDARELVAQFHADDFAEGKFGGEQQGAAFAGAHVYEAEGLHSAALREGIDPAPAHQAEDGRSDGGVAGEVGVVGMAGDEIALAEIARSVQAVAQIEWMHDVVRGQNGADRSGGSHQNSAG